MIEVKRKCWFIHIYHDGQYNRTVGRPFSERRSSEFCKSFNASHGCDGKAVLAVAKECDCTASVNERLSDIETIA